MVTEFLPKTVSAIQRRYKVDDVYVLGYSQGARIAVLTGIYVNQVFKGAVAFGLSGYETAWLDETVLKTARRTPFLLVHGETDEWAPLSISEHARDHLTGEGFEVTFRPHPGGHTMPTDQLDYVAKWIRDQMN